MYDFLTGEEELVVYWYLLIEGKFGKPPWLSGCKFIAGIPIEDFTVEDLSYRPGSRVRSLTSGFLGRQGNFLTWDEMDSKVTVA